MDDADLVRRVYEEWNERGLGAALPYFADDIELSDPPELPDAGTWYGVEAVRARLQAVAEALGRDDVQLVAVEPLGREVLVSLTWRTGGSASGVLGNVFHRTRMEDGRISRMRVFLSYEDARSAA